MADVSHHHQVMGHEEVRDAGLALEFDQQVENPRLRGEVQSRHGLVAYDQTRSRRERASDGDPLALTSRELARHAPRGVARQMHGIEKLRDPPKCVLPTYSLSAQRLRQDVAHRHRGIQRCVRVLKHHLKRKERPPARGTRWRRRHPENGSRRRLRERVPESRGPG